MTEATAISEARTDVQASPERYIQRHSLLARFTHGIVVFSCVWLAISGLFVFVPALSTAVGNDVIRFLRMSHRVIGVVFVAVPLLAALFSPKGAGRFFRKYFTSWTSEDGEFVRKFVPYMLAPKKVHMPDQDEVKSGQRIADMVIVISSIMMVVSGLVLWLGVDFAVADAGMLLAMRFVHDLFFLVLIVFVIAHFYLGAGVFQPYRGMVRLMFGDGRVSESDALYHWGFWAREELEKGDNVIVEGKES